jgi:hypothetical protein
MVPIVLAIVFFFWGLVSIGYLHEARHDIRAQMAKENPKPRPYITVSGNYPHFEMAIEEHCPDKLRAAAEKVKKQMVYSTAVVRLKALEELRDEAFFAFMHAKSKEERLNYSETLSALDVLVDATKQHVRAAPLPTRVHA